MDDVQKKVMAAKISDFEAESEEDIKVLDDKLKSSSFMFVEKMQKIARLPFTAISSLTTKKLTSSKPPKVYPNVIKKLIKLKNGHSFLAYSTLDENETPRKIHVKIPWSHYYHLYINGVISDSKKFVLDGLVTFYDADPFNGNAGYYADEAKVFSKLLKYVRTCNITDLFLHNQKISLKDYVKLAKSGTIKNVYLVHVGIKDEHDETLVQLEDIMEKLSNVEKLVYHVVENSTFNVFSISKVTFKNLDKLPRFDNLKFFTLSNIILKEFDAYGFLAFMKKYPQTQFELSFYCDSESAMVKLESIKQKLLQSCPLPEKLTVQFKEE